MPPSRKATTLRAGAVLYLGAGTASAGEITGQENRLGLIDPHQFNPGDACRGGSNFARQ